MLSCAVARGSQVRSRCAHATAIRNSYTHHHAESCCARPLVQPKLSSRGCVVPKALGKDVVDGWLDITKLVSASGNQTKTPYDDLAYSIGKEVYVDIAGWHLFMRDMSAAPGIKMSQALASQLGSQVSKSRKVDEMAVESLLKKVPVSLGGGKLKTSLYEVMPSMCVRDLIKVCSEWADKQ